MSNYPDSMTGWHHRQYLTESEPTQAQIEAQDTLDTVRNLKDDIRCLVQVAIAGSDLQESYCETITGGGAHTFDTAYLLDVINETIDDHFSATISRCERVIEGDV